MAISLKLPKMDKASTLIINCVGGICDSCSMKALCDLKVTLEVAGQIKCFLL